MLPYLIVVGVSLGLAFVELMSTFRRSVGDVVRSKWGLALIAVNVVAALALFLVATFGLGAANDLATAFIVAVTYPTLLRNPLTFLKTSTGKEGDFQKTSFELISRLYETILGYCKNEALIADADRRSRKAELLTGKYSPTELERQARNLIHAQQDPGLKADQQAMLDEALSIPNSKDRAQALALVLIDIATPERIRDLLAAP
jgi:hypothetical protein